MCAAGRVLEHSSSAGLCRLPPMTLHPTLPRAATAATLASAVALLGAWGRRAKSTSWRPAASSQTPCVRWRTGLSCRQPRWPLGPTPERCCLSAPTLPPPCLPPAAFYCNFEAPRSCECFRRCHKWYCRKDSQGQENCESARLGACLCGSFPNSSSTQASCILLSCSVRHGVRPVPLAVSFPLRSHPCYEREGVAPDEQVGGAARGGEGTGSTGQGGERLHHCHGCAAPLYCKALLPPHAP